jgi:hypothetical protein
MRTALAAGHRRDRSKLPPRARSAASATGRAESSRSLTDQVLCVRLGLTDGADRRSAADHPGTALNIVPADSRGDPWSPATSSRPQASYQRFVFLKLLT